MAAAFKCDEKVTIERLTSAADPDSGESLNVWEPLLSRYWANVQDALPSRSEAEKNGLRTAARRTRLRIQGASSVTAEMRVVLHSRNELIMQIVAGPAMMDDRVHYEFMLEAYSHG
jgi:head-tail adaptor